MVVILFLLLVGFAASEWGSISVPVVDLRSEMVASPNSFECCDPYQQTQLLFGECVQILSRTNPWVQVNVPDQLYLDPNTNMFVPYPGYIMNNTVQSLSGNYSCDDNNAFNLVTKRREVIVYKRACVPGCITSDVLIYLSIGTRLQQAATQGPSSDWIAITLPSGSLGWVLKSDVNFHIASKNADPSIVPAVIETAHTLLGWVYFWGGRSAYNPRSDPNIQLTGLDCSGLVGISYQTNGAIFPRDAHGMYVASNHGPDVKIVNGTLFFFANTAGHVTHVMLNVGAGYLIEATTSDNDNATRLYPIEERFGVPVDQLKYGQQVGSSTLWWGDFFTS